MPLTRLDDGNYRPSTWHGVKFWMADEDGHPVLCRVSHEALVDHAGRTHFEGADEEIFEAYREIIEQIASDAFDADADAGVDDDDAILVTSEALDRVGRSA